jgi:hypothetical protein
MLNRPRTWVGVRSSPGDLRASSRGVRGLVFEAVRDFDASSGDRFVQSKGRARQYQAALIYLHSTSERQRKIADEVGKLARSELRKAKKQDELTETSGTKVARRRGRAS